MPGIDEADSQFRVRIVDPGSFEEGSFRTKDLGGGVSIIIGKKKGSDSMSTQAYRFDKDTFKSKEQVQSWLDKHDIKKASVDDGALRWSAPIKAEMQQVKDSTTSILMLKGSAVDDSKNANGWSIDETELDGIAKQLEGSVLTIDHGESVRDAVGKVTRAWREDNHVDYEAQVTTTDKSVTEPIQSGLVNSVSIQIPPHHYKMTHDEGGKKGFKLKKISGARISIVLDPAYSTSKFDAVGFCASVNKFIADSQIEVAAEGGAETDNEGDIMPEDTKKTEEKPEVPPAPAPMRSEEHTSELQSL